MANSLNKITTKSILDATVATADIADDAVTEAKIADASVDEARLKISNSPTNGQFLSAQSGNTGGLTWATVSTTDSSKMPLAGGTFTGDVTFTGDNYNAVWDKSDNRLEFADSAEITFGSGADSSIVHDGSHFTLTCATGDIRIRPKVGEEGLTLEADGAAKLYYDNAERIATSAAGVEISKAGDSCELTIKGGEGEPAVLRLKADEGDDNPDNWRFISETSGNLNIQNYASGGWETNITALGNGAVELRYDNALAFQTATNGAIFYGTEGAACEVKMYADEGDDAADKWLLQATAAGAFNIYNNDGNWQERVTMSASGGSLKGTWTGVGKVLQTKMASLGSDLNTGSTSWVDTGLSETITLASTSNKVLVTLSTTPYIGGGSEERFRLNILCTPSGGSETTILEDNYYCYRTSDDWKSSSGHHQVLYSPSSTAELTINVKVVRASGGDNLWWGRHATDASNNTLIVQEIAA